MSIIHHFNLAGVDLNLLVVFDALLAERHVTRAAAKLGLSQPATSNALSRLRNLFKDELFIRTPEGMQPTAKALALETPLRQALQQIQQALTSETAFVPETAERVFALGMSDYGELVLLPSLIRRLGEIAPKVKIQVRFSDRFAALQQLDRDEIDIALGFFPKYSPWHCARLLFQERYACVSSQNNPLTQGELTLETYLAASHLLVSLREDMTGRIDDFLAQQNLQRRIAISVPHFLVAPFILADTNLIASLAGRVAKVYAEILNLRVQPLPLPVEGFSVSLLWHSKNNSDAAHCWLRSVLTECLT